MKGFLAILTVLTIVGYIFWMCFDIYDIGYKYGQVDSLTGKVKYELVEHLDKTKEWKKIKDKTGE
uniref:Uncharacterized protein n=1 Tax=viral metagenome TaxID=1070528 RepID=A0A6M3IU41_9ZZZZ